MEDVYQIFEWRREITFKIKIFSVHKIDYYAQDKREKYKKSLLFHCLYLTDSFWGFQLGLSNP